MARTARTFRPARRRGRGAFTFIEILATLALLAIVLPSIMTGISLCLSTAELARQQAQACSLGHAKLMELVADGQWQHAELAGDFGEDWPEYLWTAELRDWDGELLQELGLTVLWQSRGKDRHVTFSTLVHSGGTP